MKKIGKIMAMFLFAGATAFAMQGCFGSDNENPTVSENNKTPQEEVNPNASNNQKLVFKDCRLEEHAIVDGEERLKGYFKAEFPNLKGHEIRISMEIIDSEGEPFSYTDEEGFPVPICDSRWYKDGVATDNWMSIYAWEFERLPSGNYFVRFEAYDNTANEHLGYSNSMPFTK